MPEKLAEDLFPGDENDTASVLPFDDPADEDEAEDDPAGPDGGGADTENEEDRAVMSGLLESSEAASYAVPQNIISVAVGYAMKRGKLKKNIKKALRKLADRYHLNTETENEVTAYLTEACKPFLREARRRYGESAPQALEYAYFGAMLACIMFSEDRDALPDETEALCTAFDRYSCPEEMHRAVTELKKDEKDKLARPLKDYAERVNAYDLWDNIDEAMKKKILKGAYRLGMFRALRNEKQRKSDA